MACRRSTKLGHPITGNNAGLHKTRYGHRAVPFTTWTKMEIGAVIRSAWYHDQHIQLYSTSGISIFVFSLLFLFSLVDSTKKEKEQFCYLFLWLPYPLQILSFCKITLVVTLIILRSFSFPWPLDLATHSFHSLTHKIITHPSHQTWQRCQLRRRYWTSMLMQVPPRLSKGIQQRLSSPPWSPPWWSSLSNSVYSCSLKINWVESSTFDFHCQPCIFQPTNWTPL